MAGFFAAAAKTPISTLVIVSEMTANYSLLLPALWVCMLTFLLSDEQSIYTSQVESRSLSPAHRGDYVREVLAGIQVKEFISSQKEVPSLKPEDSLREVIERLSSSSYHDLPIVDSEGRYLGMVSLEEVHFASLNPSLNSLVVAVDLMRDYVLPLRPEDSLDYALELFVESDRLSLAVVTPTRDQKVIGIVRRSDISTAYLKRVHRERETEQKKS
jgi:CIC family chloride channel protein